MNHSTQRGFSLIEIAVSLAVMGILLASAMPSIGAWMGNTRIRNTAESINEGLQKARTEAVRRNVPITFYMVSLTDPKVLDNSCTLNATGGSWVVSALDPSLHCADSPSTTTSPKLVVARAVGDGGDGVSVSATQADGTSAATSVTFNAFGQVTGSNPIGNIAVVSSTGGSDYRQLKLIVSTGGRILMCDQGVSDTTDPRHCPAS